MDPSWNENERFPYGHKRICRIGSSFSFKFIWVLWSSVWKLKHWALFFSNILIFLHKKPVFEGCLHFQCGLHSPRLLILQLPHSPARTNFPYKDLPKSIPMIGDDGENVIRRHSQKMVDWLIRYSRSLRYSPNFNPTGQFTLGNAAMKNASIRA